MSTLNDSLLGIQLDEYRIEKPLGFGGMARVYRALDTQLQRYVALKVISSDLRRKDEYKRRFAREAQAIARLDHPHIVDIYRFGEANGLYYMAMKYIEGADLRWLIEDYDREGELIPLEDIVRFVEEIGAALDYAHGQGVIHRDVKPSNIIINQDGHAILTDFGLVFLGDLDNRGQVLGSPHYMAPEQAITPGNAVPQSDFYSLGVSLFEMLTAELPFTGDNPLDIAMQHVSELPPPPSYFNKTIPPDIDKIVLRCLEKEPHNRYQTGTEMSTALKQGVESWMTDSLRATQLAQRQPSLVKATQKVSRLIASAPLPTLPPSPTPENVIPEPPLIGSPLARPTIKAIPEIRSSALPVKAPPSHQNLPSLLNTQQEMPAILDRPAQVAPSGAALSGKRRTIWLYIATVGVTLVCLCWIALFLALTRINSSRIAAIPTATIAPTRTSLNVTPSSPPTIPPSIIPPTATAVMLSSSPENREGMPPNSRRLGEFAVEWYCNERGYGVALANSNRDWACTNRNGSIAFTLTPADFDTICRSWYKNPAAIAIRDQQKLIQAYNWSCYEYLAAPTTVTASEATPSVMSLQPHIGQDWFALVNTSAFTLSVAQVEFRRDGSTLNVATGWGRAALMPGECLRLYRGDAAPNMLPADCTQPLDYTASREERAHWFEGKVTIFINPSTSYCYPSEKCRS